MTHFQTILKIKFYEMDLVKNTYRMGRGRREDDSILNKEKLFEETSGFQNTIHLYSFSSTNSLLDPCLLIL